MAGEDQVRLRDVWPWDEQEKSPGADGASSPVAVNRTLYFTSLILSIGVVVLVVGALVVIVLVGVVVKAVVEVVELSKYLAVMSNW